MTKTQSLPKQIHTVNSVLLRLVEIDIVIDNGTVTVSFTNFKRGFTLSASRIERLQVKSLVFSYLSNCNTVINDMKL